MIATSELQRWLATLSAGSAVGIDEGGLALYEIFSDGKVSEERSRQRPSQ